MSTKSIVCPVVLAVLLSAGSLALAHEDEHNKTQKHDGHAATLGEPGNPDKVSRTIEVRMSDAMRFSPSSIKVKRGETIKFVLTNTGRVKHEMVLGSIEELREHAALMQKFPDMEHADPNMVTVEPGKTGELVWRFTRAGTFDFACLQPGHFEAGMVGKVSVKR
ncbi:MAG: cupredoxin family protein [Betaproteobacteria bacterium]|jgi:uncharacterized cupredoxin-like copper-binding protein